ncbi:ABC transporter substrate-binding protein [Amaricoccus sp.]|uniref:ABC transporter substrate-binding protein n=1 Tax=Amaricoccus sp. TaxID=1872485 RepID=UPI001B640BFD|nr:ABC transporter substrate-binding protein [Amaricoccus sp.]MBP7003072.1 ABC transporter substrate-binding protein [Amaricoccus sp.]
MKRILLASAAGAMIATGAMAQDTANVGIILGFTGPLESITPHMAAGAELAFKEVSDSGKLLGGTKLNPVRADSTCIDAAAATAAAERLITAEKVAAIVGADCSGVTIAIANNVAVPNGVVMISPSATSPALSTLDDKGLFFRTSPSDARQGEVFAQVLKERGISEVAVTFTNNDYGKGLADAFVSAFTAAGGKVLINQPHEDGKGDYSAEVAALAASGAQHLMVFGYVDQGGRGIIQAALDTGAFESFFLGDGMYGQSLIEAIGPELDGKVVGIVPGTDNPNVASFVETAKAAGFDGTSSYTGESYDAAALIALAMQKAGSTDRAGIAAAITEVANAPGEQINVGELAKGLEILAGGGDVDYVGVTGVELIGPGEAAGSYREYEVKDGKFDTLGFR